MTGKKKVNNSLWIIAGILVLSVLFVTFKTTGDIVAYPLTRTLSVGVDYSIYGFDFYLLNSSSSASSGDVASLQIAGVNYGFNTQTNPTLNFNLNGYIYPITLISANANSATFRLDTPTVAPPSPPITPTNPPTTTSSYGTSTVPTISSYGSATTPTINSTPTTTGSYGTLTIPTVSSNPPIVQSESGISSTHTILVGSTNTIKGVNITLGSASSNTTGDSVNLFFRHLSLYLDSGHPAHDITIFGEDYEIRLIAATDTSATIKVTDLGTSQPSQPAQTGSYGSTIVPTISSYGSATTPTINSTPTTTGSYGTLTTPTIATVTTASSQQPSQSVFTVTTEAATSTPTISAEQALSGNKIIISNVSDITLDIRGKSLVYVVIGTSNPRLFGIFPVSMPVAQTIDAHSGQVVSTQKPWWSFFTF